MQHLPKTVPDFSQASVLVVGDIMLDRYWFGETVRISPEAPVPIVGIRNVDHRLGGAGNVALNIAALGAKVTLMGVTGKDEAAEILRQQLIAANVTHDLIQEDNTTTIVKLRVISRRQQLLRLDFEEKIACTHKTLLLERFKARLKQTDLVLLSDYNKGTLADPQSFIQIAREQNVPVIVDPKNKSFEIYRNANMITPNFKEFKQVVGDCKREEEIVQKGRALLDQLQIDTLLITRGEEGMTLISREKVVHVPAYAREVLDVTGAGDTVIAMVGTALAAGLPLDNAIGLANLGASIVVGKLGAASLSMPELAVALTGKTNFMSGMVNEEQLLLAVQQARAQGKKIVFTNGCFDIIHAGHVESLQMAKALGDFLIVAVNTDESIQKLKDPNRPINNLEQRMTVLASLGVVDWVIPFADETPVRLLKLLQPDFLVKGGDYDIDQVVGADVVRAYGGEVRVVGMKINSSSNIIARLIDRQTQEQGKHYG